MGSNIINDYQAMTKYYPEKMNEIKISMSQRPDLYKEYPNSKIVKLTTAMPNKQKTFVDIFRTRRSERDYSLSSIALNDLSSLLWTSTGISKADKDREYRNSPSAGALYPIETYILVNRVDNLDPGLYHYNIKQHLLEELKLGNYAEDLCFGVLGQNIVKAAPVVFIWSAIFNRCAWKYKDRSIRYINMEAGHIAQNLALASNAYNLGTCQIGAFYDDEINNLLDLNGEEESVVYLSTVGYVK